MSIENRPRLVIDPTSGRAMGMEDSKERSKHWWEDLKELGQVVADLSKEAYQKLCTRSSELADLEKSKISQINQEETNQEGSESSEGKEDSVYQARNIVKRVYDVANGPGALSFKSSRKGRSEASSNAGQRKRVTIYTGDSERVRDISYYQRGKQTGSEERVRVTEYRSKEDREKVGTIITREKNRVVKRYEDRTERIVTREDGKLYSEIIKVDENGNRVSEGKKLLYPKPVETTPTEEVRTETTATPVAERELTVEQKEKARLESIVEEVNKAAAELYGPLWKKGSENKVKELLNSPDFKEAEKLLLLRISELLPLVINTEELRRAGYKEEEIKGVYKSYAEGMLFGLMMKSAPEADEKMGPFIDLLSMKLGQYKDLVIDSGILKRDISEKDKKSTSKKKQEAVESTEEIVERLVRFHEIMAAFPGAKGLLDRYANLVDLGLPVTPVLEASIQKDDEKEKTNEYFVNRVSELIQTTFPTLDFNPEISGRIRDSIIREFTSSLRFDFLSRNGLDTPLPLDLFASENAISMFNEFIASADLKRVLEFDLTRPELQGITDLRKTYSQARELFLNNFGIENISHRDDFIKSILERYLEERKIKPENWPAVLSSFDFASEFGKLFGSLTKKDLEVFINGVKESVSIVAPEEKVQVSKETEAVKQTPIEILRGEVTRYVTESLNFDAAGIYNERQIKNLVNHLIKELPEKDLTSFLNGGEVNLGNLMLMIGINFEDLNSEASFERLKEIASPATLYDKVVRFMEDRKKQIVKTAGLIAILAILSQTPLAGGVKKAYESGTDYAQRTAYEIGNTDYNDLYNGFISNIEDIIDKKSGQVPDIKSLVSVFENPSIGIDSNLIPHLEDRFNEILSNTQVNLQELPKLLVQSYAELSLKGFSFSSLESISFSGISDGLSLVSEKPQQEAQPVQPPVAEKVSSTTFYGWEIADRQEFSESSVIFLSVPEFNPVLKEVFKLDSTEYRLVKSYKLKFDESTKISDSNAIGLINNINLEDGQKVIIVKGKTGYSYLIVQENNVPAYATNVELDTISFDNSNSRLLFRDFDNTEYETLFTEGEKNLRMFPDTYREINLNEIDQEYRDVIESTSGITGTIHQLYQAELSVCDVSAYSTIVSELLSQRAGTRVDLNVYELGQYISSFYDEVTGVSIVDAELSKALPHKLYLSIVENHNIDTLKQDLSETTDPAVRLKLQTRIDELSKMSLKEIEESKINSMKAALGADSKSYAYYRHVISNEVYTDIASMESISAFLGLNIEVSRSLIIDSWKNTFGLDNIAGEYTYGNDFVSETVINNVDKMTEMLFDDFKQNLKPGSLAMYASHIHSGMTYAKDGNGNYIIEDGKPVRNDVWNTHAFTIVGVNYDEKYIIVSESNLFNGHTTSYGDSDTFFSDKTIPTIKLIETSAGGLYKISFNTEEYTPEQVAQTLSSMLSIKYFANLPSNE